MNTIKMAKCEVYKNTYSGFIGWFPGIIVSHNDDGTLTVKYRLRGMTFKDNFTKDRVRLTP